MRKVVSSRTMPLGMRMGQMPELERTPPSIVEIYTCPEAGAPMVRHTLVTLKVGAGIVGDRYAAGIGAWSKAKPEKIRHVTLISFDEILKAAVQLARAGKPIFLPHETRRNFVTWDVELNGLVGKEFSFGEVCFRGIELADPCDRPSALAGKKGFKEFFDGIGALRAEVLNDGVVRMGSLFTLY